MEDNKLDMLINELESEILKAKRATFSQNAILLDRNMMLNIISEIRTSIPVVVREATAIKRDKDVILKQADDYAKNIVEQASTDAKHLISENEIFQQAQKNASTMISEANETYRKLDYEARLKAFKILDEAEKMLEDSIGKINENKRKLTEN